MVQSTSVKHFLSSHTGAPELTGAPGTMAALIYACLVTGYNVSPADSITRDGSTVTVTVSAGHGLAIGSVAKITGADQAEYNGDHRITTATASTFEYELAEGTEPATPATGTIDCRQAPAGWERSFVSGDGYRAAFKSLAVDATGMTLYIDDTNNQGTRRTGVKGYESMTDIDTGINPFPYSAADDQWYWWYKSLDETTPLRWAVIADDRFVYIWWNRDSATNSTYGRLNAFGDFNSYLSADVWNFIVTGETSVTDERFQSMLVTSPKPYTPGAALLDSGVSLARDLQGIGAGLASGAAFVMQSSIDDHYCIPAGYSGVSFPSWVTGGAIISPIDLIEVFGGTNLLRGRCPGLYSPFHDRPYSGIESEIVQGVGDYADTCFLSLPMAGGVQGGGNSFYVRYGQVLINIVGPWRD